ncbi:type III secretion system chaperone [Ramlibacter sp. AW1]|uniref:Type III secretion system chaperone n=1 Tax=Ramlibacter aurantiacus TaxID=2801330 RepID=A0A936ZR03_9BURK|nr:type III secretion system chaperone [Ramlibacter aurantiacus]MBL0422101.1 type III secretion system chaperone [Ramlibacter aurantiacus]
MTYAELIAQLARQLRLPHLVPGPEGHCALQFDDIVVSFTPVPTAGAFDVEGRVGRVDVADPAVAVALAQAREGISHLAWDSAGRVWLRQRFFLQVLSFTHFFRTLERFVNQVDACRARLPLI